MIPLEALTRSPATSRPRPVVINRMRTVVGALYEFTKTEEAFGTRSKCQNCLLEASLSNVYMELILQKIKQ